MREHTFGHRQAEIDPPFSLLLLPALLLAQVLCTHTLVHLDLGVVDGGEAVDVRHVCRVECGWLEFRSVSNRRQWC